MRRHLGCVVVLWLAFQAAALAVSPFAMCHGHDDHGAVSEPHARCTGMEPGQTCPMHGQGVCPAHSARRDGRTTSTRHQHHDGTTADDDAVATAKDADAPVMHCVCRASDAALATLLQGLAVLPAEFILAYEPVTAAVGRSDTVTPTYVAVISTPPPRVHSLFA